MKPLQIPQEETCPVSEQLLGELYRASAHGLESLIETVPANTRAMLALYCHRRSHLQSIALAVAATCEERHLEEFGGYAGKVLFEKARKAPEKPHRLISASGSRSACRAAPSCRSLSIRT